MVSRIFRCADCLQLVNKLAQSRFSYRTSKSGSVMIDSNGKIVKTLKNARASKFLDTIASLNDAEAQLLMAKTTGPFKFGNECQGIYIRSRGK